MIAYFIKSGICMVLLFGLYWLLLRKVRLFLFNRYYLIFAILFSLIVPFISISFNPGYQKSPGDILSILYNIPHINPLKAEAATLDQETALAGRSVHDTSGQSPEINSPATDNKEILLLIYLSGVLLMLGRFCRNILMVNRMFRRSEKIDQEWYKLVLLNNPVSPFSFLRSIYVNKQDYLENRIAANVLRHELEHIRQSHSWDVIFFELLHIVFWFNPVLLYYKRAAIINHEYLADEAVIRSLSDMKTYSDELISFISRKVSVPFTSGFSPSMIRLRLLMLNTKADKWGKNIRMFITLFTVVLLMSIFSIRPAYTEPQDRKIKTGRADEQDDIVIEEVYFRGSDFKPLQALFVIDGKKPGINEMITVDPQQIKTIDILTDRKATRKYGKKAKNGVVEISTYGSDKRNVPDSLNFKPIYIVNYKRPEGTINIPVTNLYSLSIWTYPIFPQQDIRKRWRTIDIMTRDFYKIGGKVVRTNGETLPGVEVTATDNPSTATTDKEGRFLLEDVKSGALAEISAEGYEPLFFKVSGNIYTFDLTITLEGKNEPEEEKTIIPVSNYIWDFSGTWRYNKELSNTFLPAGMSLVYNILQYDSDSIMMNVTRTLENNKEYKSIMKFIFNTIKTEKSVSFDGVKAVLSCRVAPGGQSFSVTQHVKSLLGIFREQKRVESYSLNNEGNQLIIRAYDFPDVSSDTGKEFQVLVFDRI